MFHLILVMLPFLIIVYHLGWQVGWRHRGRIAAAHLEIVRKLEREIGRQEAQSFQD